MTDNTPNIFADAGKEAGYWKGTLPQLDEALQDPDVASGASRRASSQVTALEQRDHVAAALLAFFLGPFGIHKFYLGYYQAGFIMLAVSIIGSMFTFGLALAVIWVIAIVEGARYLTRSQTEFEGTYVRSHREWF